MSDRVQNSSFHLRVQSVQLFRRILTLTLLGDKWNMFPALTVYVLWRVYIPAVLFLTLADYETKQQSHEFISCLFIGRRCGNLSTCQIRGFGSERRVVKTNLIALWVMDYMGLFYSLRFKTFRSKWHHAHLDKQTKQKPVHVLPKRSRIRPPCDF